MSRWVSSRSEDIEERYNMIHGEHGLFATGGDTMDAIPKAHRDAIAESAQRTSKSLREQAATQGPKTQLKLNAAADKIDRAAQNIRDGKQNEAKALIREATKEVSKAGYPGMSEQVKQIGTDVIVAEMGPPSKPSKPYEAQYGPDTYNEDVYGLGGSTLG